MSDRGENRGSEAPTVSVVGEARLRTAPDEALVSITLSAVHDSPGRALADVARRSESLATVLDELGIATDDRSTTGVTVAEEFDYENGRRSLGHRAVAHMSVRLTDTDLIGTVLARTSDELDARVSGPAWRVSPNNPLWLEAATQAAANARDKAGAYAAGVDARLGPVLTLSEPQYGGHGMIVEQSARAAAGPDMRIEAAELEVVAAIVGVFALERT